VPKFFITPQQITGNSVLLDGPDAAHIARTLRMRPGESLTLCDGEGFDYLCRLETASPETCTAEVLERKPSATEPKTALTLYVGMPKAEKAETIVQKATELGAAAVVFFRCRFCVAKPADFEKRAVRLRKIAREAAMQCGRGRIPEIGGLLSYEEMLRQAARAEMPLFLYEGGGMSLTGRLQSRAFVTCCAVSGPEGGFSPEEAAKAEAAGLAIVTLGPRILRCETAPLAAAAAVFYQTGDFDL